MLFVVGVVAWWRNDALGAVPISWLGVMVANTAVFLVMHAEPRHQISSAIFLFAFAGAGVVAILSRVRAGLGIERSGLGAGLE